MIAAEHHGTFEPLIEVGGGTAGATWLTAVVLVMNGLPAGSALLRPLVGGTMRNPSLLRLAAVQAVVVNLLLGLISDRWLPAFALAGLVATLVFLTSRPLLAAVVGLTTAAGAGLAVGDGAPALVAAIRGVGGAVWIGGAVQLVLTPSGSRRLLLRRLLPALLVITTAVAAAGAFWAVATRAPGSELGVSRLLIAKFVVVAAGTIALATLLFRPEQQAGPPLRRASPVALVAGALGVLTAILAAGVAAMPFPAPGREPGLPVLATSAAGTARPAVFVAPGRPGWNLVHVGEAGTFVGTSRSDLRPATARAGSGGGWIPVLLNEGRNDLLVRDQDGETSLRVDTGRRGADPRPTPDLRTPDGPECASRALGAALAGAARPLTSCPADRLDPEDATALKATIGFIAGRSVKAVSLYADGSARSRAARDLVTAEARRLGIEVITTEATTTGSTRSKDAAQRPLVLVSGWAVADKVVNDIASGRIRAQGSYLAPWLTNGTLLTPPAGQLVTLPFNPGGVPALRFVAVLETRFPGATATAAAFAGWSGAATPSTPAEASLLRLYAASTLYVPGAVEHKGHGRSGRWLPDGTVVPVTGELAVPRISQ